MDGKNDTGIIVIVDDEEMVLTSLSSFLDLETEYEVQTFNSASSALEYIETNDAQDARERYVELVAPISSLGLL